MGTTTSCAIYCIIFRIGIATGDFSNMPLNVAITITVIVALMMNRKEKFSKRLKYLLKGQGIQILS